MSTNKKIPSIRIRTNVKAGNDGLVMNHGTRVRVRTGVKAGPVLGGFNLNHGVRVRQASR